MEEPLKQWVIAEIRNIEKMGNDPLNLYKKTLGISHEITKHRNRKVSDLLDRILSEKNTKAASSFYKNAKDIEIDIGLEIANQAEDIVLWANKIGEFKDEHTFAIETDIKNEYIGYGVKWSKNRKHIDFFKSKKTRVAFHRTPEDANGLKFKQSSAYPSYIEENRYPDTVIINKDYDGHDMVYEMMQTQAYKNAKTDAERQKLLSYVQRNDDSLSGMGLPASKASIAEENKTLNRNVQLPPELQSHYDEQQSFSNIQRNTGNTPTGPRHVECSLKENASDESQYY